MKQARHVLMSEAYCTDCWHAKQGPLTGKDGLIMGVWATAHFKPHQQSILRRCTEHTFSIWALKSFSSSLS